MLCLKYVAHLLSSREQFVAHPMSLSTVLQTARSGMAAAEANVRASSNNLANAQTIGFKTSRPAFAAIAPTQGAGGGASVQIGRGVRIAGVRRDLSQGAIVPSVNPLSLALHGDGLYMVAGPTEQPLFTRAGQFQLNGRGEIVTPTGARLLGYGVDAQFRIDASGLQPLTIPLGSTIAGMDGAPATMTGYAITENGVVEGRFSDGIVRTLGRIRIATFNNPAGLVAAGDNMWAEGVNSGPPVGHHPGSNGAGTIVAGAVELSNTDIGDEIVELTLASTHFSANVEVFRTADSLLDELMHIRR